MNACQSVPDTTPKAWVSYMKPNVTVALVDHFQAYPKTGIPPPVSGSCCRCGLGLGGGETCTGTVSTDTGLGGVETASTHSHNHTRAIAGTQAGAWAGVKHGCTMDKAKLTRQAAVISQGNNFGCELTQSPCWLAALPAPLRAPPQPGCPPADAECRRAAVPSGVL